MTPLPGERDLWDALRADLHQATDLARSILSAEERGDISAATQLLHTQVEAVFDRAERAMLTALEFDVSQSRQLAREVRDVRRATLRTVVLLDAFATAVAAVAAFIAFRASRHHDRLLNAHSSLLAARVAEPY